MVKVVLQMRVFRVSQQPAAMLNVGKVGSQTLQPIERIRIAGEIPVNRGALDDHLLVAVLRRVLQEVNLTAAAAPLSVVVPSESQYITVCSRPVQSVKRHPRPFRCCESDVDAEAFRQ